MPSILKLSSRPIYTEDLAISTALAPATVNETVMGAGVIPLTPISIAAMLGLASYANDALAAAGGVNTGQLYWNSTDSKVHARIA